MIEYKDIRITTAGKGYSSPTPPQIPSLNQKKTKPPPAEYHPRATALISKTFTTDPVIRFMLSSLPDNDRLAYLPAYISTLLKAAAINDAVFEEANDWACCAVWMPPGKQVDNPLTMLQAGILGVLWRIGVGGCKVIKCSPFLTFLNF